MPATISADAIPGMISDPEFKALPFDQRSALSERAIAEAGQTVSQDWDADTYKQWGDFTAKVRSEVGADDTLADKGARAVKGAVTGALDMGKALAKDVGTAGLAAGEMLHPSGWKQGLPVGKALVKGFGAGVNSLAASGREVLSGGSAADQAVQGSLDKLKSDLDSGSFPMDDPHKFADWVSQHDIELAGKRAQWFVDAKDQQVIGEPRKPDVSEESHAWANGLSRPDNAALLSSYMVTRDPAVWKQLSDNLYETPARAAAKAEGEDVRATPGARMFEQAFGPGASEHLLSASHPLMIAGFALPVIRGAAAAEAAAGATGIKAAAQQIGSHAVGAAPEMAVFGAAQQLERAPQSDAPDVATAAASMAASGALLAGGLGAAGAGIKRAFGKGPPTDGADAPHAYKNPVPDTRQPEPAYQTPVSDPTADPLDAHFAQAMGEMPRAPETPPVEDPASPRLVVPFDTQSGLYSAPEVEGDIRTGLRQQAPAGGEMTHDTGPPLEGQPIETPSPETALLEKSTQTITGSNGETAPAMPVQPVGSQADAGVAPSASVTSEALPVRTPAASPEAPVSPEADAGSIPAAGAHETDYFKGDQVAYTDAPAPEGFRSFVYLDGVKAGQTGVARTPEARAADVAAQKKAFTDQQAGFRRVRESGLSDQMPNRQPATKAEPAADKGIIARTATVPRVDIDNGERFTEYRVRKLSPADLDANEFQRRHGHKFAVERRSVRIDNDTHVTERGTWDMFSSGESKRAAIDDGLGDNGLLTAESVDPTHKELTTTEKDRREWMQDVDARESAARNETNRANDVVQGIKEEANKKYRAALKRMEGNNKDTATYKNKLKATEEKLKATYFPKMEAALFEYNAAKELLTGIETEKSQGFKNLKRRLDTKANGGFIDVDAIAHGVAHGTELFARGVRDFGAWSGRMLKQFGEAVREHLSHIWRAVNDWAKDEIKAGKGRLNAGLNPAQALAYAVRSADWLKGEAREWARRFNEAPRFTDLRKTVNGWTGRMQASSVSVLNLMKEIERRVPDAVKREGITNYIQAEGNDAVLAAREATSTGARKAGYRAARNLSADEQALAGKVSGYYQSALALAHANGLKVKALENYVNQVWKKPNAPAKAKALGEFQGQLARTFKFAKHRTFENFHAGEQAGFEPQTKDISKLLGLYLNEMNKTIATREMIGNLTQGAASDGRPLAVPVGGALPADAAKPGEITLVLPGAKGTVKFNGDQHEVRDYRTTDSPALAEWKFVSPDTEGKPVMSLGQLALHPEAYKIIKPALEPSAISRWMNSEADSLFGHMARRAVKVVDVLQGQIKAGMMSLSPFHNVQEGTHALGHKVNPFTNIPTVDPTNAAHRDMMNHGLMLAGDRVHLSHFMDGLGTAGSWLEKIPGIGPWQKAMSEFTFHHYIPGLKIKTYEAILARNTPRFEPEIKAGTMTLDDVKYLTAKQTNAAYGHLNYKDMGRSPTLQHFLRMTLLAPDFLEARAKFTGQALQGLAGKVGREQLMAMATLGTVFYVGARAMNAALNNGDTKNDLDHLFTVQAGNRSYSMRSVPEDIYRLVHDWRSFTAGRVSPLIGTSVLEGVLGVNRRGEKVTGSEAVQDTLANAIPMSLRMVPGLSDMTRTQKNHPVSPWEQFLGAAGVQVGRHSPITKMQREAHEFAQAMGSDTRGSYPVSKYQQLRYALEDQNWDKAAAEIKTLTAAKGSRGALAKGFHESLNQNWTDTKAMDAQWKATLKPEQKQLLDLAEQRRRDVQARFNKMMAN